MILDQKGKLSVVQALTAGATDSQNVIQMAAVDYAGITDLWLTIDTNIVAGGAGTLVFDLVMSEESTLDTNTSIVQTSIAAVTDLRVATIGRHITTINVGKTIKEMLEASGSDTPFIGLISTLGGSATITIDAALSPTEPQTLHHKMVVVSPVGVPAIASPGSGE